MAESLNVTVLQNNADELCLCHDAPLPFIPIAFQFDPKQSELVLITANGDRYGLLKIADVNLRGLFMAAEKLLLVRFDNQQPVEELEIPVA